ncbi:DUF1653 domain-containing protein [Celerinatantimonas yamalensis]|uniref:DUF1653 domain-containing protein n=1 Tax=Celerinatantimonas yamalensis TaxID=559956 RepID=A0ABW9GBI7_9GAMM
MSDSPSVEKDNNIPLPGLYRHFKGNNYEVLDVVRHSETEEWMVLYRPCYGERALWVRPLSLFNQPAEKNGASCMRFTLIKLANSSINQRGAYADNHPHC